MEAKLIIIKGKANKAEVSLKLPSTIGRSREADLTIAHPMVSRQHCQLFEIDGLLRIRDLGSLNGTFLGDQQIKEADLYPNAEFSIGPLTFRVAYEYTGPTTAAPTFTPAEGQTPAGDPDFQPAGDAPAGKPPVRQPPLFAPAITGRPGFDAGASDVSSWGAMTPDMQLAGPPIAPAAAKEDSAEQCAADALAEEDDGESFVGELPDIDSPVEPPPAQATEPSPTVKPPDEEPTLPTDADAGPGVSQPSKDGQESTPPDDSLDQFFKGFK